MKRNYTYSIIQFINNHTKIKKGNKLSSNKIYLLFCFLNDINIKHLNIKTFMPLFIDTFEKLIGLKLKRHTIRLYKGKNPVRCILDMDLMLTRDFESKITTESECKQTSNLNVNAQPTTAEKPLLDVVDVTNSSISDLTANSALDKTNKIKEDATKKLSVKTQKFKSYEKIKEWLKTRCINVPGENTFVHLLIEDFGNFINTTDKINNKSFINHLTRYSAEEWPNSNIKKEDLTHKTQSSYITNLKLKP